MASEANQRTLSAFLDYLRVERGSAKLTIAAYSSDLEQFADREGTPRRLGIDEGVDDELGPRRSRRISPNGGPDRYLAFVGVWTLVG